METYHMNIVCEYEVSWVYTFWDILRKRFWENGDFGPNRGNWPFFLFFLAQNNFLSPLPKEEEKKLLNEVLVTCFFHNSPTLKIRIISYFHVLTMQPPESNPSGKRNTHFTKKQPKLFRKSIEIVFIWTSIHDFHR